ncbi:MAG TPA: diaminopimelate decarboxylase [Pyrinomonadaceae bacterium]|nr:diaminopimelate decarboxylase [Pyrinomonadaceae bacterium]
MNNDWEIKGFLEIQNNRLYVGGVSAVDLAEEYGTPLFVFSQGRIKRNIERLKRAGEFTPGKLKVCYAAKANSNMAILRSVLDAGADLEVNSGGELWKALKIGFSPEQIIFNGTSKTVEELEAAIGAGIYAIQVDSLYELQLIETVARSLNKRANVSLRLVPEIETKTHSGLQTAMLTSKFGMMSDEVYTAFRQYGENESLNLCGIHLHLGSQTPDVEPFDAAITVLFEHLRGIYEETGCKISHVNLGGGFPVNYLRDDSNAFQITEKRRELFAADLEPADVMRVVMEKARNEAKASGVEHLWNDLTILLEPGRSVISDAGICLTTVRNYKKRPLKQSVVSSQPSVFGSQTEKFPNPKSETRNPKSEIHNDSWLLTDAGFNILLSMETYKWYYHLISANRANEAHDTPYKVAGPLCDGGDVYFDIEGENRLPDYRFLPKNVQPDEVLALLNCGAYSVAQMFQYNARFLPPIVLIKEDKTVELIRKRDTFEDLLTNDIW